jgi:hypothetical protein
MTQNFKKQIIGFIFALCCAGLYFLFPINQYKFEIIVGIIVFLVALPILYVRLVLHENINEIGCRTYSVNMRDIIYLVGGVILGSLVSFGMVQMGWGVEEYAKSLSPVVLYSFTGFIIYEMIFTFFSMLIFTFFAWGFVYHKTWQAHILAFYSAAIFFLILIANYYQSVWMLVPMIFPLIAYYTMRDRVHFIYIFCAVFLINLVIDTLIIMSLI